MLIARSKGLPYSKHWLLNTADKSLRNVNINSSSQLIKAKRAFESASLAFYHALCMCAECIPLSQLQEEHAGVFPLIASYIRSTEPTNSKGAWAGNRSMWISSFNIMLSWISRRPSQFEKQIFMKKAVAELIDAYIYGTQADWSANDWRNACDSTDHPELREYILTRDHPYERLPPKLKYEVLL